MNLKEIELIIPTGFKFCMVFQTNRKSPQKTALNKLVYIGTITGKHFSHFYYLVLQKEKKIGT